MLAKKVTIADKATLPESGDGVWAVMNEGSCRDAWPSSGEKS
jgi:hypothetical protein